MFQRQVVVHGVRSLVVCLRTLDGRRGNKVLQARCNLRREPFLNRDAIRQATSRGTTRGYDSSGELEGIAFAKIHATEALQAAIKDAKTTANDGLRIYRVSDAKSRREIHLLGVDQGVIVRVSNGHVICCHE